MNIIEERGNQIVEEFSVFDDWLEKYNYLIEMGKDMPLIDSKYKIKDNLITGCQSNVWLHPEFKNGKVYFYADISIY